MPYWFPRTAGPMKNLPPTLQSLNHMRDRVLLCGGLDDEPANLVKGGGDHARSAGDVPDRGAVQDHQRRRRLRGRVDGPRWQRGSSRRRPRSPRWSWVSSRTRWWATATGGASCAYTNTIAWRTPTTPLPIENDPRAVFERLFGTSGSTDPEARRERLRRDRSILDAVGAELQDLGRVIGPGDQVKLDEYLDALRDVERRIRMAEEQSARELPVVDQPVGVPNDYQEHARLMMDLLALAYQTDLTRISTFMLAREVSGRAYPEIGVSDSHHPLSHHQDEPAKLERLHKINEYHFRQFAYLVEKLAGLPEGDGSMLDSTLFLYGTGISDSNTHFHDDLPIALVGGKAAGDSRAGATSATRTTRRSPTCTSPSWRSWACRWRRSATAPGRWTG